MPVEMVCTSITRDGRVVGRLVVARDITERNRTIQTALDEVKGTPDDLVETERLRAIGSLTEGVTEDVRPGAAEDSWARCRWCCPARRHPAHDQLATIKTTVMEAASVLKRLQSFAEVRALTAAPPLDLTRSRGRRRGDAPRLDHRRRGGRARRPGELRSRGPPAVAGEASVLIEAVTAVLTNAIEALPDGGAITVHAEAGRTCSARSATRCRPAPAAQRARSSPSSPPRRASTRASV